MQITLSESKLKDLLGTDLICQWNEITDIIESNYSLEKEWHIANKGKNFELKYRKTKTIISLFPRYPEEDKIGVMIIFGSKERERFENSRKLFSQETLNYYDNAKTYRDGKWVMFLNSKNLVKDLKNLLLIKRKPNI